MPPQRQYTDEERKERARESRRRWDRANREKIREKNRKYRAAHPNYSREWQQANPEKVAKSGRKYRESNRDKVLEATSTWAAANPEKVREKDRRWRAANPERVKKTAREWFQANPDKKRAYNAKRRTLKAGNGGSYTDAELKALYAQYGNQCIGPGPHEGPLCADHVIPVGEPDSTSNIDNIQPLCRSCNSRKGTKMIDYRV